MRFLRYIAHILLVVAFLIMPSVLSAQTTEDALQEIPADVREEIENTSTATSGSPGGSFGDTASTSEYYQNLIEQYREQIPTPSEVKQQSVEQFLEVDISPESPDPFETVEMRVTSNLTDLNRAEIYWYVDNALEKSGRGVRSLSFQVGDLGSVTTATIIIDTIEGQRVTKEFTFRPADVSLLWEAQSYTPPFYKGRALASPQSMIKIVAQPEMRLASGAKLSPDELVYTWKRGNQVLQEQSGYGASVVTVQAPKPFGEADISVEVSSLYETYTAEETLTLPVVDPQVVLYEKDPLAGTNFRNAVRGNAESSGSELTLFAAPYFFSLDGLEQEWYVNGARRGTGPEFTLTDASAGARVEAVARNNIQTFQVANTTAGVAFTNEQPFIN